MTELFSGGLVGYSYIWCAVFMLFILIYSYLEERSLFTASRYFKRILLETASHLVGWIAGILIAQLFVHIIDHGVYPIGDHSFYSVGLLMLIIYDLSVILSLITQKLNIKRDTSEIGSLIFGSVAAYSIFLISGKYLLPDLTLSQPYQITLSILSGVFALLFKISLRNDSPDPTPRP